MSPVQRFDYLTEIEVLLANKLYKAITRPENREELRVLSCLKAVLKARNVYKDTNVFLSFVGYVFDLKKSGVV